jgi:hypothetical protein
MSGLPPLALLAPLLLVLQLWPGLPGALRFERPRFEQGAWWELLSAQWVHLSLSHALANAAALLLIAGLLRSWLSTAVQCLLLAGAAAGVALVIALDSGCGYYAGFSSALHGWLAGWGGSRAGLPVLPPGQRRLVAAPDRPATRDRQRPAAGLALGHAGLARAQDRSGAGRPAVIGLEFRGLLACACRRFGRRPVGGLPDAGLGPMGVAAASRPIPGPPRCSCRVPRHSGRTVENSVRCCPGS